MNEFMREAADLARLGKGHTAPNPCVGAVMIRAGRVVARGWHRALGQPHAEIEAIKDAREKGIDPARCTMAVTLEPCNHYGKTPPCTEAILENKIPRVIIGAADPNPDVSGGGMHFLQENGVRVELCDPDGICADLIADFRHWAREKTPYTYLKLAATLDGKIASSTGDSKWITGKAAREEVHELRSRVDAVIVGGNTFRNDNPGLDCRLPGFAGKQPLAVVVTSNLPENKEEYRILSSRPDMTVFWSTKEQADSGKAENLRSLGCRVWDLSGPQGSIDLQGGLKRLRSELGMHYCLCEGGGRLAMSLVRENQVGEMWYFLSPRVLGDDCGKNSFSGESRPEMKFADRFRLARLSRIDEDILMQLFPAE